ncbi:MAG: POTRA domain-containing protein, partial [Planctomycetota bacterium]|nr:POTRA domain-containing protein [Planctomycetota bacterium]
MLFRIREGERLRVTAIRFEGNEAFRPARLRQNVRTKVRGLLEKGPLDRETLERDVAALANFYRDNGYLDVRTDRDITISPDGQEAIVTFLIDEGPLYTLRSVRIENIAGDGELLLTAEQVVGLMEINPGDVYALNEVRRSVQAVRNAYWRMGYVDAEVRDQELRDIDRPQVDLLLRIREGDRVRTGEVIIKGNDLTKQNVIRREVQVLPDHPLDRVALQESERRLRATRLFGQAGVNDPRAGAIVTIQPPSPDMPDHRDVLIEVQETNTG